MRRTIVSAVVAILVLVAAPVALYSLADPEKLELDESVRRATPGQFVRLTDGSTHYEIAGPPGGHVVVLAAGFSVPYYIWDPTFAALTGAGFRVLRYDYYGRGFSDRPEVDYSQTFYVRQLTELLDSLQITDSIDLVGLSLGGAIVTSFADAFPDRVRSLIYMDPSFRTPGSLPPLASTPSLWNFVAAVVAERGWADEQPGDFLHPERFPDWADRHVPIARIDQRPCCAARAAPPEARRAGGPAEDVPAAFGVFVEARHFSFLLQQRLKLNLLA